MVSALFISALPGYTLFSKVFPGLKGPKKGVIQ